MPATREQIYAALQAADKAGNTDDAKELARQYASMPAISAPKPATAISTAGRALWNAPMDLAEVTKGAMQQFGPDGVIGQAIQHPVKTYEAAKDWTGHAADILGGAAQHVRDMSSPDEQGSASRMDTTAFDNMLAAAKQKYGTKQGIYKQIGDHPVGTALMAASVVDPALRLAGVDGGVTAAAGAAGDAFKAVTDSPGASPTVSSAIANTQKVVAPLKRIVTAQRTGDAAAATMSADAAGRLTGADADATAAAQAASERATRAAALAERARARSKTLNDRSTTAAAEATPPEPDIGAAAHLSDIGDSIRQPAIAAQDTINDDMRTADDKYRTAMQQVADDRAAAGVGVSDSPIAKAMIKQSQSVVAPNAATRPSVGNVPVDSAGAKLHKMMLDVLQPQNIPLTDVEAAQAIKAGAEVQTGADGGKYRVIKPSMENVDDFRRYVGKVANGQVDGYEGINANEARNMYGNLTKVLDQYSKGASKPVQANWAAGKKALSPFDNVRAGQAIVGTQPGTGGVASVAASTLPGRIMAGGRDTLKQAAAVAGEAPVASALRSQVQNAFAGVGDANKLDAMIKPGSQLGEAVNTDDDLSAAVRAHIAQVRQANVQGVNATDLAARATTNTNRASKLDKVAQALQGTAEKSSAAARGYQQQLSALENAAPSEVGAQYLNVLKRAHSDGTINTDQFNSGVQLAAEAKNAFALKATRDEWLRRAALTVGVSGLTAAGVDVVHSAMH